MQTSRQATFSEDGSIEVDTSEPLKTGLDDFGVAVDNRRKNVSPKIEQPDSEFIDDRNEFGQGRLGDDDDGLSDDELEEQKQLVADAAEDQVTLEGDDANMSSLWNTRKRMLEKKRTARGDEAEPDTAGGQTATAM